MKIGIIGPTGGDEFGENMADSLRRMGHEAIQLGPARSGHQNRRVYNLAMLARQALPGLDERAQQKISRAAISAGCEVVINDDLYLMPEVVASIRRTGARVVFWFPDAVSHLGRQLMLLSSYDALFFKEPHIVDLLGSNLGMPVYYLPEACNPRWHRPLVPGGTEPYIIMAGSMYPYRIRILERLISKGIPIRTFGVGIPRWIGETPTRATYTGRYLVREEKARAFRSAAGVLNTMSPEEVFGVNKRLFEAAGCGAAVLTEYRPMLPQAFAIGDEVLAFRDFDELLEQAIRLLNETGLTAKLGDAAAMRAHRDHSYEKRLAAILEKVS
jgi:spore maturation protein CgeB